MEPFIISVLLCLYNNFGIYDKMTIYVLLADYFWGRLMNVEQLKKANTNCFYIVIITIACEVILTLIDALSTGFTPARLIILLSAIFFGIISTNGIFKNSTSGAGSLIIIGSAVIFYAILVILTDNPVNLAFALPLLLCSIVYLDLKVCKYEMIVMSLAYLISIIKDYILNAYIDSSWLSGILIIALSFAACIFSVKNLNEFRSENNHYVSADAEKTLQAGSDMAGVAQNISSLIEKSKDNLFTLTQLMDAQKFVLNDASNSLDANTNVINVQTRRIQVLSDKELAVTVARDDLESASADMLRSVKDSLKIVTQTKESYKEVSEKSDLAVSKAKALMIKVDSVKKLVDAFNAMSKQAELIALHASIEASKAGQEDSGLVSVANEIRSYGEKNSVAATKISEIISAFSLSVQDIINNTDNACDSISGQIEMLDKVNYNLLGLETKVQDVLSHYNSAHQELEAIMASSSEIKDSISSLSSSNSKAVSLLQQSYKNSDEADEKFGEFTTILGDVFTQANTLIDLHEKARSESEF